MSASDKKKLRKEQNAAAMTERQKAEQKTQKKQKIVTLTFVITMVLVVALVLVSVLSTPINRAVINNTVAAEVEGHKISATEFNYFYIDCIQNVYSQYDSYGDYQDLYVQIYSGWNPAAAVGKQTYNEETGETWADHFAEAAADNAKWTYAMYDLAMENGYELTEDDQTAIDNIAAYMKLLGSGYGNDDGYVRAVYGTSASLDSYMEYYTISYIASAYAREFLNSLEYTDTDYREYEADKMAEYNSYSWLSYYVKANDYLSYLELGTTTTGEDGKDTTTYTDEEKQTAVDAAKADAEALLSSEITDAESLNAAINALAINAKAETAKSATEYTDQVYDYVSYYTPNEEAVEWLTSDERAEGDITSIEYTTEDADGNVTVNGYYVLFYVGSIDNSEVNIGTVRHLLVAFEKDKDGKVTDEAKAAALKEAEDLLAEYEAGKKTEEAFTALLKEHSDDVDDKGNVNNDGLYSDITPASGYVAEFTEWATAAHEAGDVEIIETSYGYHIMYYVSCAELNYRDTMIKADIQSEDYNAWEEDILEDITIDTLTTKYINKDFIMSSGT